MPRSGASYIGLALLIGLAVIVTAWSLRYLTAPPGEYGFEEQASVYRENPFWLLTHILFGAAALTSGALQFAFLAFFAPGALHRWMGALYVVSATCAAVAGVRLAFYAYGGVANTAAFMLLALFWMLTTFRALHQASVADVDGHRIWMVRSYALAFAAVTLRIETGLLLGAGLSFDDAYRIVPWTSWALNLILVEWVFLKKRTAPA